MIEQITKGIKISIETAFEGTFYKNDSIHYAFSYEITIENQSIEIAQLFADGNGHSWMHLMTMKLFLEKALLAKNPFSSRRSS